jgi:hypothetical protein
MITVPRPVQEVADSMKVAYKRILLGAVFSLMPLSVLAQVRPSAAEAFRIARGTGVPIDWTHRPVVFSWGDSR